MPFSQLTPYCRSNTAVDIARIHKVSARPPGMKCKFGILVPKVIKNEIELDENIGNQLWQKAINTETKQFTDYQKFIKLVSVEDIPSSNQILLSNMI
jgi:hypothetical protein